MKRSGVNGFILNTIPHHRTFFFNTGAHFLGRKMHILMPQKSCDHYDLVFYAFITCFNFVILSKNFAQESKKFQELDKKNVQNSICQNLFAQKRAALGNLRNFFGRKIMAPLWCGKYCVVVTTEICHADLLYCMAC